MIAKLSTTGRCLSLAVAVSISACAMSAAPGPKFSCNVVDGVKWLAPAGGEAALCRAIGDALASHSVEPRSVAVRVHERGMFAVNVTTADGQVLPELNFAQSDRAISSSTLGKVAQAVAVHAAKFQSR